MSRDWLVAISLFNSKGHEVLLVVSFSWQTIDCVASVSVGFRGLFLILALAPISRGQNTVPVPFLGLSLLSNPTETLAMQARQTKGLSMRARSTGLARFPRSHPATFGDVFI